MSVCACIASFNTARCLQNTKGTCLVKFHKLVIRLSDMTNRIAVYMECNIYSSLSIYYIYIQCLKENRDLYNIDLRCIKYVPETCKWDLLYNIILKVSHSMLGDLFGHTGLLTNRKPFYRAVELKMKCDNIETPYILNLCFST